MNLKNLQNIADNANTPHIRFIADSIEINNLGRHKLGRAKKHLQFLIRIVSARQPEIYNFDSIPGPSQTKNIFRLHIQV